MDFMYLLMSLHVVTGHVRRRVCLLRSVLGKRLEGNYKIMIMSSRVTT